MTVLSWFRWSFFLLLVGMLVLGCNRTAAVDEQMHHWQGIEVESRQPIYFAKISGNGLVLNFYSPSCVPCVEELPALEALYRDGQKQGTPVFLVVFAELLDSLVDSEKKPRNDQENQSQNENVANLSTNLGPGKGLLHQARLALLQKDMQRRNIRIPMVLLDAEFAIIENSAVRPVITGTPETIFFQGSLPKIASPSPSQISVRPDSQGMRQAVYNFVGPIALGTAFLTGNDIRFSFAQKKMAELASGESAPSIY